jgi:hypothetical protein
MKVSGLAPVEVAGIENINVTELVPGHMAYRTAMPKLLREVGWMVESDEFSEIEDPDPENHEQRQRELISEIEEARKELEKKEKEQNKKGGFFSWRKKKAAKKDWEVYDENSQKPIEKEEDPAVLAESTVMFDVDALRAEVAALSAEGIEIKEIKSTLPPMKIDMAAASPNPYSGLRETKSYNDSLDVSQNNFGNSTGNLSASAISGHSTPNRESRKQSFEEYDERQDGGDMTMIFDTSFKDPPASAPSIIPSRSPALSSGTPDAPTWDAPLERPALKSATTEPSLSLAPGYNAWADEYEDEFGKEKEMKMTFE